MLDLIVILNSFRLRTRRLVSGAGDIKITKDGNVLLHEMQIQHPTASLIARASTAQDDMTGDGTTSTVLLIGELLKQADIFLCEGLHPRILTEGFDLARVKSLEILDELKVPIEVSVTWAAVSVPISKLIFTHPIDPDFSRPRRICWMWRVPRYALRSIPR